MASRAGWGTLSPSYRQRLQSAGITRRQYEQGASLKTARGHPVRERPTATKIPKHGVVREQYEVTPRSTEQFRASDVRAGLKKVPEGRIAIAIEGTAAGTGPGVKRYRRKDSDRETVEVEEDGELQEGVEIIAGHRIDKGTFERKVAEFTDRRGNLDLLGLVNTLNIGDPPLEWLEVDALTVARAVPPPGEIGPGGRRLR